jgi:phage portal protein BeeE
VQLEAMEQMYYSQCIQSLLTNFEACLDDGLGLDGTAYGTEFDITDLIWMDTATKTKAAADAIGSGAMSPDEARKRYFDLGPVTGGDTPYMQQQMFSLKALAQRDHEDPFAKPTPAPMATPAADQVPADELAGLAGAWLTKALAA